MVEPSAADLEVEEEVELVSDEELEQLKAEAEALRDGSGWPQYEEEYEFDSTPEERAGL